MAERIEITVSGDLAAIGSLSKQLQFAALKTTNEILPRAQKNIIRGLGRGLHLRGNWYNPGTKFGINIKFAKKSPTNAVEGSVGTAADWLLEEEGYHGGVKRPEGIANRSGYTPKGLSVPHVGNARPSLLAKIPPSQKAGKLLANPKRTKAFKIRTKTGKFIVLQRVGLTAGGDILRNSRGNFRIGRKSERKGGTKTVFKAVIKDKIRVPQKHIFTETARKTLNITHYGDIFNQELLKALKTAKK